MLSEEIVFFLIFLSAAVLRFHNFYGWSLSNDELSAITRAALSSPREWIGMGEGLDGHPLGVQAFLFVWMKIFGNGAFAVRLPFVLFGIGCIPLIYSIASRWFGKITGLFASAVISFSGYFILYSQLARPYSPGLFFSLLTVFFWTKIIFSVEEKKVPLRNYIGFAGAALACMYIHYFSFLFVLIVGITGLFFCKRKKLFAYILSGIAGAILFLPHLKFTLEQLNVGGLTWLPKPGKEALADHISYAFNDSDFFLWPALAIGLAGFIFYYREWRFTRFHFLTLLFFGSPFCIAYFYSIYKMPVLQQSVLIFSAPFLIIFIFSYYTGELKRNNLAPLIVLSVLACWSLIADSKFYHTSHFGEFRELAAKSIEWQNKYGAGNITSTININSPKYIDYYFEKMGRSVKFSQYSCNSGEELGELKKIADNSRAKYFLHAWSTVDNLPETELIIRSQYPAIAEQKKFYNSGITLYYKPEKIAEFQKLYFENKNDFENINLWENDSSQRSSDFARSGIYSAKFDPSHEYGPTFVRRLNEIRPGSDSVTILVSAWVLAPALPSGGELVISFESLKSVYDWHSQKADNFIITPGVWTQVFSARRIPRLPSNDDIIKVYLWNAQKKMFYADDFDIRIE